MGKITPEEKAQRSRKRMIDVARQSQIGTYTRSVVAPLFQKMIRAEAAALPAGPCVVIVNGEVGQVVRQVGQCACVTCGAIGPWKGNYLGGGVIETGHFVPSRRASVLFEPTNAHPQCKFCNRHLSGNQGVYEMWMRAVFGQDEIDRLRRLKNETRNFTHEALVDMRLTYTERLKAAEERMQND